MVKPLIPINAISHLEAIGTLKSKAGPVMGAPTRTHILEINLEADTALVCLTDPRNSQQNHSNEHQPKYRH